MASNINMNGSISMTRWPESITVAMQQFRAYSSRSYHDKIPILMISAAKTIDIAVGKSITEIDWRLTEMDVIDHNVVRCQLFLINDRNFIIHIFPHNCSSLSFLVPHNTHIKASFHRPWDIKAWRIWPPFCKWAFSDTVSGIQIV